MRALIALLLTLALHAEVPVSPWTLGPAPGFQSAPLLAANGNLYLAVWADDREWPSFTQCAARLDANGDVLDPAGIRLDFLPRAFTSDGERWVMVDSRLTFAAIDRDGRVVMRASVS